MTAMNFDKWRHYLRARRSEIFGKTDDAIRDYRVALQADPGFRKAANALAYCYAQAGQHAEAIRYFEHAARLGRPDATVHYNLGYSYEKYREPRKAIESFRAAVGLNPSLDRAWYGMGLAHAVLGEHREAMEAFGQAADLQPMSAPVWYQLGMASHHAREHKRLRQAITHLNRFDPKAARRLILETGTTDLAHLVKDLAV